MRKTDHPIRALVIGDAMVDAYLTTTAAGVSDEAPIAVLDWVAVERSLGGMANVAASLRAAGAAVTTIGMIGDDEPGAWLRDQFESLGIGARWFGDGRPTIEKTRVGCGQDFLARIDVERSEPPPDEIEREIESVIRAAASESDVIIVADYAKGLLTERLARSVVEAGSAHALPIIVDTKPQSMMWYTGASLFTPNEREARDTAAALDDRDLVEVEAIGEALARRLGGAVLITRGGDGMILCENGAQPISIPAVNRQVNSTSGAGDVVACVMAIAAARDEMNWESAARWAADVVGRVIERPGTCALQANDLAIES